MAELIQESVASVQFEGLRLAQRVMPFILETFADEITLDDLARVAGMSRFNFCRRFHQECGLPPMRWLWSFRTILTAEFITLDPKWSLTDVAFSCGFKSSAHFSRSFKILFHQNPSQSRREALARSPKAAAACDSLFGNNRGLILRAARAAIVGYVG